MIIVVDASELFSALIAQGATLDLFFNPNIEAVAPEFIIKEFDKHKNEICRKSGLTERDLEIFIFLISEKVRFFSSDEYGEFIPEATDTSPDPDDVDYLALALKLNCPIWTEDKELKKQTRVKILSTIELLKDFG